MRKIVRHVLNRGPNAYSAVYQTSDTRELDLLFGLKGSPVNKSVIEDMYSKIDPFLEESPCMHYFIELAGSCGNVVALPFFEIEKISGGRVGSHELCEGIRNNAIINIEDRGTRIVSPVKGQWLI